MEDGISTALIEQHASVLTKSLMTRLLDLEMRCKASDAKIEELEQCWKKTKNILQQIRPEHSKPWRNIESDEVVEDPEEGVFQLPSNLYSILAVANWKSDAFWTALLYIILLQFVLLALLVFSQMDVFNTITSRSVDNLLNLPPNVEGSVRTAQIMILNVALFSQSDLRGGIEDLFLGIPATYRGAPRFHNLNRFQWRFAAILRVCQGLLYLACTFILTMQSETVFDVLLNVLGIAFVSDLDDLVFRLGTQGYFEDSFNKLTIEIEHCDFVRTKNDVKGRCARFCKKFFPRMVFFACFVVLLYFYFTLLFEQEKGKYTVQNIYVELSDPLLASFSGNYIAGDDPLNRRLVYTQVDNPDTSEYYGQFRYCLESEGGPGTWVFTKIQSDLPIGHHIDPCKGFIFTSKRTIAYDILSIDEWYFDLSCGEHRSVDTLTIRDFLPCQGPGTETYTGGNWDDSGGSWIDSSSGGSNDLLCPVIQGAGSLPLYKVNVEKDQPPFESNATLDRGGIYMSRDSTTLDGRELLFFAGSAWVMTTEEQLGFNGSDVAEILDSGLDLELDWVNLITENVSPSDGLGYWPNQEQFYIPKQNQSLVPFADTSLPVGSFECIRCESSLNTSLSSCNTGNCNLETGQCDCLHNETGAFCENPPLGNGICDDLFNKVSSDFDDGDCCGATCTQPHCGKGGLQTLFGWNTESLYYTDMSTEEIFGFQKCKDGGMTAVLLELVPLPEVTDLCVPAFTVECGEASALYLRTQLFCTTDLSGLQQERIMVPPGATCSITIKNANLTNGLDRIQLLQEEAAIGGNHSGTTNSSILVQVPVFDEVLEWSVP